MQNLKQFARFVVFVCLAAWICVVSLVFSKPFLVHLNQNQHGEPENRMSSFANAFFFPSHDKFVKIDWNIAINTPLIGLFPALVAAFVLDIFILQKRPIKIGFLGVFLLAMLLIGAIDFFLWLALGGWSPPAPALVTLLVLLVAIPLGLWQEVSTNLALKKLERDK